MSKYNPRDVSQYYGKVFVTQSGSRYGVTRDGRFTGRSKLESADILMIGGVGFSVYYEIGSLLGDFSPEGISRTRGLILENAEEVRPGLHLALSFTDDYIENVEEHPRHGFISSTIKRIESLT